MTTTTNRPEPQTPAPSSQRMQCMEVWGGNREVDRHFEMPGLEVWVYSRPYLQADRGGDVYYISSCASGRITRTLLADVSGHGAEVAQTARELRDLMRRNVNYIRQSRLVTAMNREFGDLVENGGFATALVSTFFAPTRTLSLSNAGHPEPLALRAGSATWASLAPQQSQAAPSREGAASNTPFGVTEHAEYSETKARLEPGDLVLCYSDALSEARDADGRMLGSQGLCGVLDELAEVPAERLIGELRRALRELHPENLQQDDVTIVLFRANGTQPTWKANLAAPLRLLGPVNDATEFCDSSRGNASAAGESVAAGGAAEACGRPNAPDDAPDVRSLH